MSIPYDPTTLLYAVVEHLPSSKHLCDPMDTKPELDGQYHLVCLAVTSEDASRLAHILQALGNGRYQYTVCVAEPDTAVGEPFPVTE